MISAYEHVKRQFDIISKTASTIAKMEILKANSENELFLQMIRYLLNPYLITGISEKKISKQITAAPTKTFDDFTELFEYLLDNNTGSDAVISNIQEFLASYDEDMQDFFVSIITKSAKLGSDVKTINKVFGKNFIPAWEVQQSYTIENYSLKEGEWFALTEKLNGVRGTYYSGRIISRQGKDFTGLEHIISDISKLFDVPEDWVIDGELIRKNIDGLSDNENFRIGTGLLAKDEGDKSSIMFVVFDFLPKPEFDEGISELTYKKRHEGLVSLQNKINTLGLTNITVVKTLYEGNDVSMIDHYLNLMVRDDKEGLMLNRDSKYACKRHNGILKVKRFYTIDLLVTDVQEGSGRIKGKLGAFVVDFKGNAINVGSGMTDEQRESFWKVKDELIGRVIEVKYKEVSSDKKTGLSSLQFPIFVALREEGKTVSYY